MTTPTPRTPPPDHPVTRRATSVPAVPWASSVRVRTDPRQGCPPFSRHVDPQEPDVVALWYCPVCDAPVHRRYRPGRQRVYCTNACRQVAYRRRRARTAPALPPGRPERATSRDRTHGLRPADPAGLRRDSTGRRITACGTFARAARDRADHTTHSAFYPTSDVGGWCRSCRRLLTVPVTTLADALADIGVGDARTRPTGTARLSPGAT